MSVTNLAGSKGSRARALHNLKDPLRMRNLSSQSSSRGCFMPSIARRRPEEQRQTNTLRGWQGGAMHSVLAVPASPSLLSAYEEAYVLLHPHNFTCRAEGIIVWMAEEESTMQTLNRPDICVIQGHQRLLTYSCRPDTGQF